MTECNTVFTFTSGLPGLPEELKEFKFLTLQENSPYYLLQSVDDEQICLILLNPFSVFPEYEFNLPEEEKEKLKLENVQHVAVFCVVNASQGLKNATINLLAPVVVNTNTGLAKQVVLNDKRYSIRHPLFSNSHGGE